MGNTKIEREFTGLHMLLIVVAFFGVIISVNIFMATKAIQSWTGLVVKNSYVASQDFNQKLDASRVQADLNLQIDMSYSEGILLFVLLDEDNKTVTLENVQVALTRPIGVALDKNLSLEPTGVGYAISEELETGVWNVVIKADMPGQPEFNYRARLIVAPDPILGT